MKVKQGLHFLNQTKARSVIFIKIAIRLIVVGEPHIVAIVVQDFVIISPP